MGFSLVQSAQKNRAWAFTDTNPAFASNVTQGNLLVAGVWFYPSTMLVSPTDSQGNAWAAASPAAAQAGGPNGMVQVFGAIAGSSAANTVTLTATNAGAGTIMASAIMEFSGNHATPIDGSGLSATGGSGQPSGSLTTSNAGDLIVAFCVSNGGTPSAGSGFTILTHANVNWYEGVEYNLNAGAAGSKTVAFGSSAGTWALAAGAFKAAAVGASIPIIGRFVRQAVNRASTY